MLVVLGGGVKFLIHLNVVPNLKLRIHFFPQMPVTTRITLQFIEGNPELNLLFATVSNTECVVFLQFVPLDLYSVGPFQSE